MNNNLYNTFLFKIKKKYKKNINFLFYKQFYQYIYFIFKKLILIKLINSTMYLSSSKQLINKNLTYFFLGFRNNKLIFNLYYSLLILKQFIFFAINLLQNGGNFLICNNSFLIESIFEYIYYLPQGFILGMPFGGLLTNKKNLVLKLKSVNYGFYNFTKINEETKEKILYCERMIYNQFFEKNYYNYCLLPSCLIIFDLNSYIFYEASKLNIPILGLVTNIEKLNTIIFPILFNNESIYSLFLFLIFLNEIFTFGLSLELIKYKINLYDYFKIKKKLNNNKKIIIKNNNNNILLLKFFFKKFNIQKKIRKKLIFTQWKKNYIFNVYIYFNFSRHFKFFQHFIKKRIVLKYQKKKNFQFQKRRNFQTNYLLYYQFLDLYTYFHKQKFYKKKNIFKFF